MADFRAEKLKSAIYGKTHRWTNLCVCFFLLHFLFFFNIILHTNVRIVFVSQNGKRQNGNEKGNKQRGTRYRASRKRRIKSSFSVAEDKWILDYMVLNHHYRVTLVVTQLKRPSQYRTAVTDNIHVLLYILTLPTALIFFSFFFFFFLFRFLHSV